jgi:hypothetical protein
MRSLARLFLIQHGFSISLPLERAAKGFQADVNANPLASWNVIFGDIRHLQHQVNILTAINTLDYYMLDFASLWQSAMKAHFVVPAF